MCRASTIASFGNIARAIIWGGNLIYLVAKRNQRTSGQVLDSLMSAIGTAHACFIKHVLRRHQLIPVAVDGPPFTGK